MQSETWTAVYATRGYLRGRLDHAFCDFGLAAYADGVICADFLDKLVLRHGLGRVVYVEALRAEGLDGLLADVLKEKETEVLIVDGMESLRLTNGKVEGLLAEEVVVDARRGGGGRRRDDVLGDPGDGDVDCGGHCWQGGRGGGELEEGTCMTGAE